MFKRISSLYIALVVVVALSTAYYCLLQLAFRHENEQALEKGLTLSYAAKMDVGLDDLQYDEIVSQAAIIEGVHAADREWPIPEYQGPAGQEEEWQSMWREYLPSVLYATAELQVSQYDLAPRIAEQIQTVSGVMEVAWDREGYEAKSSLLAGLRKKQSFLSTLFFLCLVATVIALIYSFPDRLRRDYVIRTGVGGAGSQISPEKVWIQVVLENTVVSMGLFAILFFLGTLFFPLPLKAGGYPGTGALLFQGILIVGALSAAVCLVGWWMRNEEYFDASAARPPRAD